MFCLSTAPLGTGSSPNGCWRLATPLRSNCLMATQELLLSALSPNCAPRTSTAANACTFRRCKRRAAAAGRTTTAVLGCRPDWPTRCRQREGQPRQAMLGGRGEATKRPHHPPGTPGCCCWMQMQSPSRAAAAAAVGRVLPKLPCVLQQSSLSTQPCNCSYKQASVQRRTQVWRPHTCEAEGEWGDKKEGWSTPLIATTHRARVTAPRTGTVHRGWPSRPGPLNAREVTNHVAVRGTHWQAHSCTNPCLHQPGGRLSSAAPGTPARTGAHSSVPCPRCSSPLPLPRGWSLVTCLRITAPSSSYLDAHVGQHLLQLARAVLGHCVCVWSGRAAAECRAEGHTHKRSVSSSHAAPCWWLHPPLELLHRRAPAPFARAQHAPSQPPTCLPPMNTCAASAAAAAAAAHQQCWQLPLTSFCVPAEPS
jgi:hypothetical protein